MDPQPAELESLRRFAQEQAAEAAELRVRVRWLESNNRKLERRLKKVYRSWTWRIGRVILFPYYVTQWMVERLRPSPYRK
jgi:hypothetical protein